MDFKLLDADVSYEKAQNEYNTVAQYRAWRVGFKIIFGSIIFFGGLAFIVALSEDQGSGGMSSVIFSVIGLSVLYLFRHSFIKSLKEGIAYKEFAKGNGLGYVHNKTTVLPYDKTTDVLLQRKGVVFGHGHSTNLLHAVSNNIFAIYTYSYVTGSGKNSKTHFWTVLVFRLNKKLPHVLFDNKKNNFWRFSNLPSWFSKEQKVSLGAAVDDHFDLYSPEGYAIDTLSYLTPELLELLIKEFSQCDVEVIDNLVYVYQNGKHTRKAFPALYARLNALGAELNQNSRVYKDDRVPRTVSSDAAGQHSVAKEGRRLKKSNIQAIIGVVLFVTMFSFQIGIRALILDWTGVLIILPFFAFAAIVYFVHKHKKTN